MDRLADELGRELSRFGVAAGLAEIVSRWPAAAGEAIARNAWPARIARDGTLHVATSDSVWAFELGQRASELAARLGVPSIRFAPGPLPSPAATPQPPSPSPVPTPEDERAAAELAAQIEDDGLREVVQRAVSLGRARAATDRVV